MSLESALEEERIEILKLLHKDEPEEPLQVPVIPQRLSRSASPMRLRKSRSPSENGSGSGSTGGIPFGGKINQSTLLKNFHNLSPAAQELLLSTTAVPELLSSAVEQQQLSGSGRDRRQSASGLPTPQPSSMLLPSAGPELTPYPGIHGSSHPSQSTNHRRASSFGSDGGALRRYKSADDSRASLIAYLSESGPASPTSPNTPLSPSFPPNSSHSRSPGSSRKSSFVQPPEENFSTAYRRLSKSALLKAGSNLAPDTSKRSPSADARLEKDEDDAESAVESSSSSEEDDEEDSGSDLEDSVRRQVGERHAPQSLLAAMEDERKAVTASKRYSVQSLITAPPPSHDVAFASYKKHLIHPKTAFDLVDDALKDSPYTSDKEEAADIRKAVNLPVRVSDIESNREAGRVLRTITRGDYEPISRDPSFKKRSYIVATDASPESLYALEWTVGTILRDGNLMYAVCAMEEPEEGEKPAAGGVAMDENGREAERISIAKEITSVIVKLLKKTRLQVECVVEVMHCKSPKHLMCDVIDYLSPTMVILGSRGRSAIKGVLLGSFSNYLVTKSSVPVMVARKKLKKSKHQAIPAKFSNNLREGVSNLSMAKVD
ncbi:uncharacterized protein V2V93DRAFT_373083 [Kockiozyma suomiensis]|uniref:uncharacterized protein n=1 Tax=Kockiozyma suomiensis TaxID=1337062 RepID=UPI003343996A